MNSSLVTVSRKSPIKAHVGSPFMSGHMIGALKKRGQVDKAGASQRRPAPGLALLARQVVGGRASPSSPTQRGIGQGCQRAVHHLPFDVRTAAGAGRRPREGRLSLSYESLMSEPGLREPPPTTAAASAAAASAATAAAPPSTTSAPTPAASASTPFGAGASLVNVELSSLQLLSVQVVDRGLGFGLGGHLHKRESSWLATELVRYEVYGCDLPEGFEG